METGSRAKDGAIYMNRAAEQCRTFQDEAIRVPVSGRKTRPPSEVNNRDETVQKSAPITGHLPERTAGREICTLLSIRSHGGRRIAPRCSIGRYAQRDFRSTSHYSETGRGSLRRGRATLGSRFWGRKHVGFPAISEAARGRLPVGFPALHVQVSSLR